MYTVYPHFVNRDIFKTNLKKNHINQCQASYGKVKHNIKTSKDSAVCQENTVWKI